MDAPLVSEAQQRRFKTYGLALCLIGLACLAGSWACKQYTQQTTNQRIQQVRNTQNLVLRELTVLNSEQSSPPEPLALKQLLELGQAVSAQESSLLWLGPLFQQRLQYHLTQAIEALSRPIGGLDSTTENRAQREREIRIEAQPRLQALEDHLQSASNGFVTVLQVLSLLFLLPGLVMLGLWLYARQKNMWIRRVNTLSLALRTQSESDQTRLGATLALEGVLAAIENTRNVDHKQALMQLGTQLEELKRSGQKTLEFAHAFHKLSSQATSLAKVALTNNQRNMKADGTVEQVREQLDALRDDMRNSAQGLKRAGEVSRLMLAEIQLTEGQNTENENAYSLHVSNMQALIGQSQQALKEAIEGLVLATQKINAGHSETNKLAEHLAVNHTAWSNLLEQIEQYAESASSQSEQALHMAKHLIKTTKISHDQAAKAPPQLLP
jgi:hypothetical protein